MVSCQRYLIDKDRPQVLVLCKYQKGINNQSLWKWNGSFFLNTGCLILFSLKVLDKKIQPRQSESLRIV